MKYLHGAFNKRDEEISAGLFRWNIHETQDTGSDQKFWVWTIPSPIIMHLIQHWMTSNCFFEEEIVEEGTHFNTRMKGWYMHGNWFS